MHSSTISPENIKPPDAGEAAAVSADRGDTIVAPATPAGRGGISIVRLSGEQAATIATRFVGRLPPPRVAGLRDFAAADGLIIDRGLVLFFPAPNSYSGEDMIELHAHGSPMVVQMLIKRCLSLGARLARPGEFSERAFLNGRLDLAQAEAVADLIESGTEAAARAAVNSLKGDFSERICRLVEQVTELRVFVEAALDFAEEEIDFLSTADIARRLTAMQSEFDSLRAASKAGQLMRDGFKVALAGLPNVGKSSLFNALSRQQRAIVSTIPGTTRDLLVEHLDVNGLPVELVDTAGLRPGRDEIEREGIQRARNAIAAAHLVLLVVDDADADADALTALKAELADAAQLCLVRNKIDLTGRPPGRLNAAGGVALSAKTGAGLALLLHTIQTTAGYRSPEESGFIARQRHIDALDRAARHLQAGLVHASRLETAELLAEEMAACQKALGEITGDISSDALLGHIFGTFCVGK